MADLIITDADDHQTFHAAPDETVELRLSENPTTGYHWEVSVEDGLEQLSDSYSPNPVAGVGEGGIHSFRFRALRSGASRIDAKLQRQWVGDSSIVKRYVFMIEIDHAVQAGPN